MTVSRRYMVRSAMAMLASVLVVERAAAQYGDAYHAPDYSRLRQMTEARIAKARDEHFARIAPSRNSSSSRSGASSSSSGGSGSSWGMYGRINAQREAGARIDARQAAFDAKEARLRALVRERKIQIIPADYERLRSAALEAGHDPGYVWRRFGVSPDEIATYRDRIAESLGMGTAAASGSSTRRVAQPDCLGTCTRTVTGADGSVYVGNIRNGAADGQGKLMSSGGAIDSGTWRNGAMHGEGISTSPVVRFKGQFENGRWFSGRVEWLDSNTVFEGVFDSTQAFQYGTITSRTHSFTGTFQKGRRHRGTVEMADETQVGTFDEAGNIRAGRVTKKQRGVRTDGYYDENTRRHGYAVDVFADGSSNEQIFDHDRRAGPVIRTRANGEVITGVTNEPGYQIFGMMRSAAGTVTPTGLTSNGEYITLPAADHARARTVAAQSAATLMAERAKYVAMMESMQ